MGAGSLSLRMRRLQLVVALTVLTAVGALAAPAGAVSVSWSGALAIDRALPFSRVDGLGPVGCARSGLCVAIDSRVGSPTDDAIVVSRGPGGGRTGWQQTIFRGLVGRVGSLTSVSCPSARFCAISTSGQLFGGHAILTSTDPTGGAAAWRVTSLPKNIDHLDCLTARECVGIGNYVVLASRKPAGGARAWRVSETQASPDSLACSSSRLCVVTASYDPNVGPVAMVSTNPWGGLRTWHSHALPRLPSTLGTQVTCPGDRLCVIGGPGYVITSRQPAARRPRWRFTRVPYAGNVKCPSVHLCVAITGRGQVEDFVNKPAEVVISRNPTGGRKAWKATPLRAATAPGPSLSCPSVRLCVAVDVDDRVLTSSAPARGGPAWGSPTNLDLGNTVLTGVSCVRATSCTAVDDGGRILTSAQPSDPRSWSRSPSPVRYLGTLSCTTAVCVGGGETSVSTFAPGGATRSDSIAPSYGAITQVSCVPGLCAAADAGGLVHVTTDPSGGAAAWKAEMIGDPPQCDKEYCNYDDITDISCASARFCAAADSTQLWITTDPLAGAQAWHRIASPDKHGQIDVIACPSEGMCVALTPHTAYVTRDPSDPNPRWTSTPLPHTEMPGGLSCPTTHACVAVDSLSGYASAGDPSGGPWTAQRIDYTQPSFGFAKSLTSVSCEPSGTCVTVDGQGRAFVGALTG